jgi:lipoprotein-releasing system ATP-binding protein
MADIIRLEKVSKVYGEKIKTQVLFDIDLAFEKGSFNSIIGASGSGKSTLLNIIGTLDKPTTGKIFIGDDDVSSLGKKKLADLRNKTLGFIFQFHYLLPEFTALENVLMPYRIKGRTLDKSTLKKADELMDMVGLSKVKNNPANNMSGGATTKNSYRQGAHEQS